jgi:glutaconyl-CoA decarboxylase
MKKFQVTVNGNTYEVEVADLGGAVAAPVAAPKAAPAPAAAPKAAAPAPAPAAAPAAAPAIAEGETVEAPMPGKVFKVLKKVGDAVAEGEVVMILEAMKMENEITTGVAGTVKQIPVAEGQAVNPGDVLFVVG